MLTGRCSRRHAATLAAIAVVLSTVFTMTVSPNASAATAKASKTKDISEAKLRTLDYTDGLLSTGTLANLDPQVITSQSSPGAVTASFDPSVCMVNGGGLDKGIVTGASNTYEATTLNAFDAAFSFASQKQARQYLDSLAQRSSSCTTFTVGGSTFTISPPKLPKAGDQLATFRASGSVQGTTINVVQLFERKGQFVNYLSFITPEELTDAALVAIIAEQNDALGDLVGQTKAKKK